MPEATIVTTQFDRVNPYYQILLNVFLHSIKKNMPGTDVVVLSGIYPQRKNKSLPVGYTANKQKLKYWVDEINNVKGNVIFMDCDMLVVGDMSAAFDEDFDIAYTFRNPNKVRHPINGGVVFTRINDRVKDFFRTWQKIDEKMYNDADFHRKYRHKYRGMNQASFGWMIENYSGNIDLSSLSCRIWNVCDEDWQDIDSRCRCIHIKNKLRKCCLAYADDLPYIDNYNSKMEKAFGLWQQYFKEMIIAND